MTVRQPIVSVLGHVDHGKTTLLDRIRGTSVVEREAGRITQHIGATEVPLETINGMCGRLLGGKSFKIPGLLFIDTPGHHSFATLRARGGSLADIAVLVIDINEGIKPQTRESIEILRRFKTPFVIAANKIDLVDGWRTQDNTCLIDSMTAQTDEAKTALDDIIYKLVGNLYQAGFPADRYDRISDFTKTIAIIPISAKHSEGLGDLLMVLCGLAQRFLEEELHTEDGPAQGTVLEVKEEKGLGTTLDVIISNGTISQGDTIVVGGFNRAIVSKVRALLKPKPLDEIRDPTHSFDSVKSVSAAAGIKITATNLEGVLAGTALKVVKTEADIAEVKAQVEEESAPAIKTEDVGIVMNADALGSLEALSFELSAKQIPIKKVGVGDISKRDIIDAATISDPVRRAVMGFNVKMLPDAEDELGKSDVKIFSGNVIYKIIEDYEKWVIERRAEIEKENREVIVFPAKFKILRGCIFRVNNPAVVGVRILAGKIRPGIKVMRPDGKEVGTLKSIQEKNQSISEAKMGSEVAIAIDGATVGRQIREDDTLYADIPEGDAKKLQSIELSEDEKDALREIYAIKKKERQFWGM